MIVCVRRSDKTTHYCEPITHRDHLMYFVIRRDSMRFIPKDLPLHGSLMSDEQFEEYFYVPEN